MMDAMGGTTAWWLTGGVPVLLSLAVGFGLGRLVGRSPTTDDDASQPEGPEEILARRLAAGEIDDDEFLRSLSALDSRYR